MACDHNCCTRGCVEAPLSFCPPTSRLPAACCPPPHLSSVAQSLVVAPLFVWMEVLFALGYRPALVHQLEARVAANVAAFQKERQRKKQ